jgi:hypothetical protein
MASHFCHTCMTHGMYTPVDQRRVDMGYTTCLPCGEREARSHKHTIVPMHKSNYMVVTDRSLLAQITRPGRGSNH